MTTDNDKLMDPLYAAMARQRAEVKRLIDFLSESDWRVDSVEDGEGEQYRSMRDGLPECLDAAVACDDAFVTMDHIEHGRVRLYIVHGNGPGELVSDGTRPDSPVWDLIQAWSEQEQANAATPAPLVATRIVGAVSICNHGTIDGVGYLELDYDGTYDGFKAAPAAVEFQGRTYGKASHNSDTMRICYRTDCPVAYRI